MYWNRILLLIPVSWRNGVIYYCLFSTPAFFLSLIQESSITADITEEGRKILLLLLLVEAEPKKQWVVERACKK